MNEHVKDVLVRLSRLLRSRVIICMVGLYCVSKQPSAAEWIAVLCGLAIGVSGIEEWRGRNGKSQQQSDVK